MTCGLKVKWMQLEDFMLSEVSQVQKDKHFSHRWKIDPKNKHIHKNKYYHIQTHVEHVCNSGTTVWNSGRRKRKREC
jgi:hypothetical protein